MTDSNTTETLPPATAGWLALLGGGEFSFGETVDADRAWIERAPPGPVGFIPAAAGRTTTPGIFAEYLKETFDREVEIIPIYRAATAAGCGTRSGSAEVAAVYLGGGVTDHLLEAIAGDAGRRGARPQDARRAEWWWRSPPRPSAPGAFARSIFGGNLIPGFGWLPDGVVEPNFDPGHDRRLRKMLVGAGVELRARHPGRLGGADGAGGDRGGGDGLPDRRSGRGRRGALTLWSCDPVQSPAEQTTCHGRSNIRPDNRTEREYPMQMTLAILKPDSVEAGNAGKILAHLQRKVSRSVVSRCCG